MDEISNKTLAILLIGAIVISLGGTLISLNKLTNVKIPGITGFATGDDAKADATVALQITSLVEVRWMVDSINWGTGQVNSTPGSTCTLQSFAPSIGDNCTGNPGFTAQEDGLVLENSGTVDASLKIKTLKSAAQFIDGSDPIYQWKAVNTETGACTNSTGFVFDQFYNATIGVDREVCSNFTSADEQDEMRFDVKVVVPTDTDGQRDDIITATATEI